MTRKLHAAFQDFVATVPPDSCDSLQIKVDDTEIFVQAFWSTEGVLTLDVPKVMLDSNGVEYTVLRELFRLLSDVNENDQAFQVSLADAADGAVLTDMIFETGMGLEVDEERIVTEIG